VVSFIVSLSSVREYVSCGGFGGRALRAAGGRKRFVLATAGSGMERDRADERRETDAATGAELEAEAEADQWQDPDGVWEDGESRGSVAGGNDRDLPVEPGSPTLEGALFALLGAAVTVVVFFQLVPA
jgi:hypothetical protein